MGIDVKDSVSKTTGHTTLTFENYRLENKLLQNLGDLMFMIISKTVHSKISPFIRISLGGSV